jgi:hypothetical protein
LCWWGLPPGFQAQVASDSPTGVSPSAALRGTASTQEKMPRWRKTSCFRSSNERRARAVSLTRGREELPRVERLAMTRGGKTSFPAPLAMIKSQTRQGGRTAFLPYHSRPSLTLPLFKSARLDVLLVGIGLFRQLINNIAPERCTPLPPVSPWIISRIRSLTLGITSKVNHPRIAIARILDC